MPKRLDDPLQLQPGSHCLSFHVSAEEAADHAVRFLAGAPDGQAAHYWVADASLVSYYNEKLAKAAPIHVGCVAAIDHEHVELEKEKLRPAGEIREFVSSHAEGVTGGADTISHYWTGADLLAHLEYESWFDDQPRSGSRFLCPYDLRRLPSNSEVPTVRALAQHHSHVVLSNSTEPEVKLLQLFVFRTPAEVPPDLRETLLWAMNSGFVSVVGPHDEFSITPEGEKSLRAWSKSGIVD